MSDADEPTGGSGDWHDNTAPTENEAKETLDKKDPAKDSDVMTGDDLSCSG